MRRPKFGEWLRGVYASEDSPIRDGMFVEMIKREGCLNSGTWYRLTDGKGKFWEYRSSEVYFLDDIKTTNLRY